MAGVRLCIFNTITVIIIDSVTNIIVNNKYFPMRGITRDVGGIKSANSKKNTVSEIRIEIHRVIFSPESDGK